MVNGPDGKPVGSLLIAQPFTKDEYFQPRPSAASYDASAGTSSALSANYYMLRYRVAQQLGPIVKYMSGPKAGQLAAPDIEAWFQQDSFGGQPHIVAQWADTHNGAAQGRVSADPSHATYITEWAKDYKPEVADWIKQNPGTPTPQASDLAMLFFENFSKQYPGKFPSAVTSERLRSEIEMVGQELTGSSGLRGRARAASGSAERARGLVGKNIRSVVEKIRRQHPALGRHFASAISTGYFCTYQPEPDHPISWQL
jgi:hypothetical protein